MKNIVKATIFILTLVFTGACRQKNDDRMPAQMLQEIRQTDKLLLATMSVTKTATMDKSSALWGKRIAVYSYDTYLRAYIDLSELGADDLVFDDVAKTVSVMLPPVRTELSGRDMNMRKEYDNIGLLRDSLDAGERAELKEIANRDLKRELVGNRGFEMRLTETAKRKARQYFEALFADRGYTATVDFKTVLP